MTMIISALVTTAMTSLLTLDITAHVILITDHVIPITSHMISLIPSSIGELMGYLW